MQQHRAAERIPRVTLLLQAIAAWYREDALPRFNAANTAEDLSVLQELLEEATQLVEEVRVVTDFCVTCMITDYRITPLLDGFLARQ